MRDYFHVNKLNWLLFLIIQYVHFLYYLNKTFIELYNKLDNVNCMGISNRNPTKIEYGFKGMGAFSYLIFDENLNLELQEKYSDDCSQMFYKEKQIH